MKKILLLALPLMVMCFASCEKDNEEEWVDDSPIIQFKDPKFLEAIVDLRYFNYDSSFDPIYLDKNHDGQISEKEASAIEMLECSNAGIRSMDEIKYFTSLTSLSCGGNQLTSLDLSNNTSLTSLRCEGNQLTTLDVSNNTALEYLNCGESYIGAYHDLIKNSISSLDLSNNKALATLNCSDNQLTSLDVSNCTVLTRLDCGGNQLTSLDLNSNKALSDLYCDENQLTSLDVSKNTALTWFVCTGNPLTKLILYKYHMLDDSCEEIIEEEYGDIIEYVE